MSSGSEGVFTPVSGDLALGLMRRTLGCVVNQVWQCETCSNSGLIGTVAGVCNVGIAVVAGALVTWSVYRAVFDTARTGAAGGEASTGYSVVRIGLGAVLLLPVSAGFTLAQLLVVQLLVWGSGLADTVWSKAATVSRAAATRPRL